MKRDMNLVREILKWAEQQENGYTGGNPSFDEASDEVVAYHVHLMWEAGLINAIDSTSMESSSPDAEILSITWDGYEFLDAARDDNIWNKAKESIIKPTAGVAFDVLLEWLKAEMKQKLGMS